MSDDMGMAEEAMNDAIVESAGYDDEQATAPDEAEALIKKNAALMNGYLARIAELDAQIAALQEIVELLIDERCKVIMLIEKLNSVANDPDWKYRGLEHDYDWYAQEARRQLVEEHPEAFR